MLISKSEKVVSTNLKFGPKCQFLCFKSILLAIFVTITTVEFNLIKCRNFTLINQSKGIGEKAIFSLWL